MKGGVAYDSVACGFRAIVHTWDNVNCEGAPDEWTSKEIFVTEAEAMAHYRSEIQPGIKQIMSELANKSNNSIFMHREL